jgi:hypothetical protein
LGGHVQKRAARREEDIIEPTRAIPRRLRFPAGPFEHRFQPGLVARELLPRLAADERNEELADPAPFEVEPDREARPIATGDRLDGGRERAAAASNCPRPRRIQPQ